MCCTNNDRVIKRNKNEKLISAIKKKNGENLASGASGNKTILIIKHLYMCDFFLSASIKDTERVLCALTVSVCAHVRVCH